MSDNELSGSTDARAASEDAPSKRFRLCAPPSLWEVGASILLAALALEAATEPSGLPVVVASCALASMCFVWPGGAFVLGLVYLLRLAACVTNRMSSWRDWRWYVTLVFLIVAVHAELVDWPLTARFEHDRAAFAREAESLLANPPMTRPDVNAEVRNHSDFVLIKSKFGRYVGSYYVRAVVVHAP